MEIKKVSKKALRSLLKDSFQKSLGHLELPEPNKKVKKIIDRTTKKMAAEFSYLLKREFKRSLPKKVKAVKEKASTLVHAAVA
jgi:hypothetical protein